MGQRLPFATFGSSGAGSSSAGSNPAGKKAASGLIPNTPANLIDLSNGSTVETGNTDAQGKITFAFSPLPGRSYVVDGSIRLVAGSGAVVAPAAPTIALTPGNGQISIAWADGANGGSAITSHKLYRGTVSGNLSLVGTISTGSPYVDTVANGTSYLYQLTAVNGAGESARSAEASATGSSGAPLTLAQFPQAAILLHDPAVNLTADGSNKVTAWAAKTGAGTFGSNTAVEQPTLIPDGWAAGQPLVRFAGNGSTGASIMRSTGEAFVERWWDFLLLGRPNADQNAVATNKEIFKTGRLSDNLFTILFLQRQVTDTNQDTIYTTAIGSASATGKVGFGKGTKAMVWGRANAGGRTIALNSGTFSTAQANGAGTITQTVLGGSDSAISNRAAFDFALRLRVNTDLLPGKDEQLANGYLIEGLLAWTYGIQALLRSDHPFKAAPPQASDYTGQNRLIIGLGNSLTFGTFQQMPNAWQSTARGLPSNNQGVSGDKPEGIFTRFQALAADELQKNFYLGDVSANPSENGTNPDTVRANIISAVETAQGRGAGNAHIVNIGVWIGFISSSTEYGQSGRAAIDAKNATIAAAYPNYYYDVFNAMVALGAPGGAYPDAVAYAKGWIPDILRDGTTLHLSTLGYLVKAQLITAFMHARGWDN